MSSATTPSTLRTTSTYPPPTPPYSEEEDSGSEPPSPKQPASPSTPKRTPKADVPSPIARYPVPATHYVPTDKRADKPGKIPGWVLQAICGAVFFLVVLMIAYSGPSGGNPNPSEPVVKKEI